MFRQSLNWTARVGSWDVSSKTEQVMSQPPPEDETTRLRFGQPGHMIHHLKALDELNGDKF